MNSTVDTLVLRPSRMKLVGLLLLALVFVAAGAWMIGRGDPIGWLCVVFFGLAAISFVVNLLPQASFLKLSQDGFEFASLFRRHHVRWADVSGFRAGRIAVNKMVLFDVNADVLAHSNNVKRLAAVSQAIAGATAALPDTYGMSAEALADVLNDWHKRHHHRP